METMLYAYTAHQEFPETSEDSSAEEIGLPEPRRVEREGRCIHGDHAVPAAGHGEWQALLQALQRVPVVHEGLHVAQGQPVHVPRHPEVVELQLLRVMHHLHATPPVYVWTFYSPGPVRMMPEPSYYVPCRLHMPQSMFAVLAASCNDEYSVPTWWSMLCVEPMNRWFGGLHCNL